MFLFDYVKDKSIKREINEIIELMISLENKIDALNEKQKDWIWRERV